MIFNLSVSQEKNCGYITVDNVTTLAPGEDRSDYGIAIYVFKDASFYSGDISNVDQTIITVDGNGVFEIIGYGIYKWEVGTAYVSGNAVFDQVDGLFYRCTNDITGGSRPGLNSSNWAVLGATVSDNSYLVSAGNVQTVRLFESVECPLFTKKKSACHTYILQKSQVIPVNYYVGIFDYKDTVIQELTFPSTDQTLEITLPGDNVYRIGFAPMVPASPGIVFEILIHEWCDLRNCAESMLNTLLARCDDPCSEDCNDECQNQRNVFRNELNKMIAIYYPMIGMIYSDVIQYAGITTINEARMNNAQLVGDMIAQLKVITDRCGLCDGTTLGGIGTNSSPCNC